IYKLIRATLDAAGQGDLIKDAEQYEAALRQVIRRCQTAYLILLESEERYNLVHAYIARPILEAPSDIEPVEAQANRLLDQYLEDQRRNAKVTIPSGDFRFINKYASADHKAGDQAV